jgi:hypothetical protein
MKGEKKALPLSSPSYIIIFSFSLSLSFYLSFYLSISFSFSLSIYYYYNIPPFLLLAFGISIPLSLSER